MFLKMLLLGITLVVTTVGAVKANSENCIQLPTAECVFDLAIEATSNQPTILRADWMVEIAAYQEMAGFTDGETTLDLFIASLDEDPEGHSMETIFIYLSPSIRLRDQTLDMTRAPNMAGLLAEFVLAQTQVDMAARQSRASYFLVAAGEVERTISAVQDLGLGPESWFNFWMRLAPSIVLVADETSIARLISMDASGEMPDVLERARLINFIRSGDYENAIALAEQRGIPSEISSLTNDLSRNNRSDDALRLADELINQGAISDPRVAMSLARTFALLGNGEGVETMGRVLEPHVDDIGDVIDAFLVTASVRNGDLERGLSYIEERATDLRFASAFGLVARAHAGSGTSDMDALFNWLSESRYYSRLPELARYQAQIGDIEGALQSLALFRDLFAEANLFIQLDSDWRNFERYVFDAGYHIDAIEMAYWRGDAGSLGELAYALSMSTR